MCTIQREQFLDAFIELKDKGCIKPTYIASDDDLYQAWLYYSIQNKNFRDDAVFYINQNAIIMLSQWGNSPFKRRRALELFDAMKR